MIVKMKCDKLLELYESMLRIRCVERAIAERYNVEPRPMHTPVHLYEGQEAVASGVCLCLNDDDVVFSTHRDHGHYIAKGGNVNKMVAELYSKREGCCKGKGGSMHLCDVANGVSVSSAIVAGNVPIATGAALAMKYKKKNSIAVAFMGDGATEEGSVYESICFAKLRHLPILYVIENNRYAINSPLEVRELSESVSEKFRGIIEVEVQDGNDAEVVYNSSERIINKIREDSEPMVIEFMTYRMRGHSNTGDGKSRFRTQEEIDAWVNRDPIRIMEDRIIRILNGNRSKMNSIRNRIESEVSNAFAFAEGSEFPDASELYSDIYEK